MLARWLLGGFHGRRQPRANLGRNDGQARKDWRARRDLNSEPSDPYSDTRADSRQPGHAMHAIIILMWDTGVGRLNNASDLTSFLIVHQWFDWWTRRHSNSRPLPSEGSAPAASELPPPNRSIGRCVGRHSEDGDPVPTVRLTR